MKLKFRILSISLPLISVLGFIQNKHGNATRYKSYKGWALYTAYGAIPRLGGRFYWDQIVTFISAAAEMIYLAMFDEIDEGAAIMKISDAPSNKAKFHFSGNDGVPSDQCLLLTGLGAQMLRKQIPLVTEMPGRE